MKRLDSLSFDDLIELYDETRCFDTICFEAALGYIADRFPARSFPTVLEPGIGTGRIALPLAMRGYRVAGVDLSRAMLDALRDRIRGNPPASPISYLQADGAHLPFRGESFEIAVAVHFFYFLTEWRRAAEEILRVLRPGRPVILMHTGSGLEIPFLNERYVELCATMGFPIPVLGVKSTKEVVEHYRSLGCTTEWVRDRWRWTAEIRPDRAIEFIRRRAYSFTAFAPEKIHRIAVQTLAEETKIKYGDPAETVRIPNQIYLAVVQKP